MKTEFTNESTEILLPHYEVVDIPLSCVRSELLVDFCGYETLLENFLTNLN